MGWLFDEPKKKGGEFRQRFFESEEAFARRCVSAGRSQAGEKFAWGKHYLDKINREEAAAKKREAQRAEATAKARRAAAKATERARQAQRARKADRDRREKPMGWLS